MSPEETELEYSVLQEPYSAEFSHNSQSVWQRSHSEPFIFDPIHNTQRFALSMEQAHHPHGPYEQTHNDLPYFTPDTVYFPQQTPSSATTASWPNTCSPFASLHQTSRWDPLLTTISSDFANQAEIEIAAQQWIPFPVIPTVAQNSFHPGHTYSSPYVKTEETDCTLSSATNNMKSVNPELLLSSTYDTLPSQGDPLIKIEMVEPSSSVPHREKRKRSFTTEDNAKCSCDLCGRLFQRTYNLKEHMKTHQEFRAKPFCCNFEPCVQRFVRKTDLKRHFDAVHLRVREHVCMACGSGFARKDTLGRHMDDGCSSRSTIRRRQKEGSSTERVLRQRRRSPSARVSK